MGMTLKKGLTQGCYSEYMSYLWEITSEDVFPSEVEIPNEGWEKYIDLIWESCGYDKPTKTVNPMLLVEYDIPSNDETVVIGYSGGKDSLACALRCEEQGLKPVLYHVKGITRSNSYAEEQSARRVAQVRRYDFVMGKISYSGSTSRVESPVRNNLVLAYMIDYMVENDITNAMVGTHLVERVKGSSYNNAISGMSDCIEINQAFVEAVRYTFPSFTLLATITNIETCCMWLFWKYPRMAMLASSCFMADRLKDYRRSNNMEAFGIKVLPQYFCLNCLKCCREYLCLYYAGLLGDMKAEKLDDAIAHCVRVLKNKLESMGIGKKEIEVMSDKEVLGNFIQDFSYIERFVECNSSVEEYMVTYKIEPEGVVPLKEG